jgi:hypothetical protein
MKHYLLISVLSLSATLSFSQSKFAQLDMELPTPNEYRTAGGLLDITITSKRQIIKFR